MSNVKLGRMQNHYVNADVESVDGESYRPVVDKTGSHEGTARELAKHVDETVRMVHIDKLGGRTQIQVSIEYDSDDAPKGIRDVVAEWGYERSDPAGSGHVVSYWSDTPEWD